MKRPPRYALQDGWYYYFHADAEHPSSSTDRVALVYDKENFALLKHGMPERCAAWMKDAEAKMAAVGARDAIDLVMMTLPRNFSVEKINHTINTSGYVKYLLEELKLS